MELSMPMPFHISLQTPAVLKCQCALRGLMASCVWAFRWVMPSCEIHLQVCTSETDLLRRSRMPCPSCSRVSRWVAAHMASLHSLSPAQ